mmetsp:Transcript_14456/g.38676  ORF Transcript_14456/g.38676 Transcript_14456/m.38676 type:complete len:167 (+) Transcript_14456:938-1438(+)
MAVHKSMSIAVAFVTCAIETTAPAKAHEERRERFCSLDHSRVRFAMRSAGVGTQRPRIGSLKATRGHDEPTKAHVNGDSEEAVSNNSGVKRTCRRCLRSFLDPTERASCFYHSGDFLGAENSKFLGFKSGSRQSGTTYFYDCCGATDASAAGCTRGAHITFDEDSD